MINLKTLIIRRCHFSKAPKHLPNSLRVLEWKTYPSQELPSNFDTKQLHICKLVNMDFMSPMLNKLPRVIVSSFPWSCMFKIIHWTLFLSFSIFVKKIIKYYLRLRALNFDYGQGMTYAFINSLVDLIRKLYFIDYSGHKRFSETQGIYSKEFALTFKNRNQLLPNDWFLTGWITLLITYIFL